MSNKFVIYKRLSKEDKTRTQHGFDSQQLDIEYYFEGMESPEVVGSFQEFISGGADVKPELEKAMKLCRETGATLLVAKLDRLSRRVSQIANYMEGDVEFKVATMPSANNMTLHVFSALAEEERRSIQMRIKRGLEAARKKNIALGAASPKYKRNPTNPNAVRAKKAKTSTMDVAKVIKTCILSLNKPTYQRIASVLTEQAEPTPSGAIKPWQATQVQRVCERHQINIYK